MKAGGARRRLPLARGPTSGLTTAATRVTPASEQQLEDSIKSGTY